MNPFMYNYSTFIKWSEQFCFLTIELRINGFYAFLMVDRLFYNKEKNSIQGNRMDANAIS